MPTYYENRLAMLALDEAERPKIDPEFEEATEGEEVERKEKLKSKWTQLEAVVGAQKRLAVVARDIVEHYEKRLEAMDGKAMVVCMSRRICVELFDEIVRLRPEWAGEDDERGAIKVVMTGSASDPAGWQRHIRTKPRRWARTFSRSVQSIVTLLRTVSTSPAGDGILATFDGPARAVRSACGMARAVRDLGIEIRAGLHTGEIELTGEGIGGIAVHIGARVIAPAAPGEVLVSSTVKDLVAGSGIQFADRGVRTLKGVPGEQTSRFRSRPDSATSRRRSRHRDVPTTASSRLPVLASPSGASYTNSMKTAVSVPDEVFRAAERQARRTRKSRSQLYSEALAEYLARHGPDEVTDAMNRVVEQLKEPTDKFVSAAARRVLERSEW